MIDDWTTKQIDKYILVNKKLGSGAFGTVYRGYRKDDESKQVAVKTIPIKTIKDSAKMIELIKREINILQQADHPNIVKLYDVARTPHYLYLFLEYCNDGDLKKYLQNKNGKRLSEVEAVIFLKHIVEGFKKLYQLKIIHRDIKPANILIHNGVAKITDFGFARVIETEMNDPSYFSRVGSPLYMAPQILEGQAFSSKCDVWSLGIMLYELLYGRAPWDGDSQYGLLQNIKKIPVKFPDTPTRSEKVKDLLTKMLQVPEKDRFTWEQVFSHEVVQIQESIIKQNMESMMKDKEDGIKPAAMNKLYQQDLVAGYIKSPKEVTVESSDGSPRSQDNGQNRQVVEHFSQVDLDEEKGKQLISGYDTEQKKRKAMLKYNNYFLFERNIAFFFNYVMQKIIKLMHSGDLKISKELYFQQILCISKNQNLHLQRLQDQLASKNPEKFDKETWGRYLSSSEFKKISSLVNSDMKHTREFFEEIQKRGYEVIQKITAQSNPKKAQRFIELCDNNFATNPQFQHLYQETIKESIVKSNEVVQERRKLQQEKKIETIGKELLLLTWFYTICLNPYAEFNDINLDFNQFYEDIQQTSDDEILERIKKKIQ